LLKTKLNVASVKLCLTFFLILSISFGLRGQEKKDTISHIFAENPVPKKLIEFEMKLDSEKIKMPIEYFFLRSKLCGFDEKYLQEHKLFYTELTNNYKFNKEELNSGLNDDQLIAVMKNKKQMMDILSGIYEERADVNWTKIEQILGITKEAAAFIIAAISLM
jgi:hypothetical protein